MKISNVLPFAAYWRCSPPAIRAAPRRTPPSRPTSRWRPSTARRSAVRCTSSTSRTPPASRPAELTAEQRAQLLDNLVRGEIIAEEAVKEGLDKTTDTASLLSLSRLQILQQAGATHYLEDKKPTDAELKAEYDAQVAGMPKTQYHARHILVTSQDAAQKIIDELKKGAQVRGPREEGFDRFLQGPGRRSGLVHADPTW
jgi:hypothetical protein